MATPATPAGRSWKSTSRLASAAPAPKATVIIPANNEQAYIGACLDRLAAFSGETPFEIIVVAIAQQVADLAPNPGRPVRIFDTDKGDKLRALQLGDEVGRAGRAVGNCPAPHRPG